MRILRIVALAGVSLLSFSVPAFAQDNGPAEGADDSAAKDADIVVTGTLIRGKVPVGSNAISLGQQKLEETGAVSANQVLASIPQVSNYFNRVAASDLSIAVNQIQIARPNIRNISGNASASSGTLVLVDGHRVATAGVNQASVDPDLIPAAAIARVEVVTEGGSATYGADAVAGTINFITHKRFDGIKVDAHYGIADSYSQWDASIIAGTSWDSGSVYVSYTYNHSDPLYGRDRSYVRNVDYAKGAPYAGRDLTCANSNLVLATTIDAQPSPKTLFNVTSYAGPNFNVAGTANRCDNRQDESFIPEVSRHGVLAGLTQEFGDNTSIDVRAYYSQRTTTSFGDLVGSVAVGPLNPAAASLPAGLVVGPTTLFGFAATTAASVNFNLSPLLGPNSQRSVTRIKQWGANLELKQNLDDNWQLRALFNWGQSDTSYTRNGINQSRLNAAGLASAPTAAFDPLDVTNNDPGLIADLIDNELAGRAKDRLLNFRTIVEGKLFDLPGGDARLAVGYEFMDDRLEKAARENIRVGTLGSVPVSVYSRQVHSLFGELQLPLIGDGDGGSMLTASASGRYDHYSDFGSTFNPKFGLSFKPTRGFTLRGNWGTSFTAPTPIDQLGAVNNTFGGNPGIPFIKPGDVIANPNSYLSFALQGAKSPLEPQTADTWSVGVDLEPVSGVRISASYYDVNFKKLLGIPTPGPGIFNDFPSSIQSSLTGLSRQQIIDFFGSQYTTQIDDILNANPANLTYEVIDFRTGNYGELHVKGVDFSVNLWKNTGFGSIDFAWNGNLQLARDSKISATSAPVDSLATETSPFSMQTQVGANIGAFRAQATWNHRAGYAILPTTSVPVQTRVGGFDTVNLFFKYDVSSENRIFKNLSFTLNIDNVFDQDPPVLMRNGPNEYGYANGSTLGRLFQFGISKKY
jgi:iron complex outermembrane receptor protein